MSDKITYELKKLVRVFEKTWIECAALRAVRTIETMAEDTANWEKVYATCELKAKELFQPVLSDLDNGIPLVLVLEKLRERLEEFQK